MRIGEDSPTVGVIGGGQLGRMLGEAAAPLGIDLAVLDPTPNPPAAPVATRTITAPFDDPDAVQALAASADYLTLEIELADPDALRDTTADTGIPVHPDPSTLRITRDKLHEKQHLADAGIPVPAFKPVNTPDDLHDAIDEFGLPVMVKARRGGYDGRGNFPVTTRNDIDAIIESAPHPLLVEDMVPFDRELSVIAAKGTDETRVYPPAENIHEDEILRESIVPARTTTPVRDQAQAIARDVLDTLDGRGVYGIELFEVDHQILVNEIAPRPHNSGHYTIEAATTSQFEQHLRAVVGYPLGDTSLRTPVVMGNILGDTTTPQPANLAGANTVLETPGAKLHWYGKREVRPQRKMGHLTLLPTDTPDPDTLLATTRALLDTLTFNP